MLIKMLSKQSIILLLTFWVVACGYHLRGSIELPEELKRIFLQGASGALHQQFKKTLKSSSGELVSAPEQAKLVINVLNEKASSRVLALSSTGRANEYELSYRIDFELYDGEGNLLVEKKTIEIRRDYFNDQEDVLAKGNETNIIWSEIYRQTVRAIVDRARFSLEARKK